MVQTAVAFQFKHCGRSSWSPARAAVMEAASDQPTTSSPTRTARSVLTSPDPKAFEAVKEALRKAGFKPAVARSPCAPKRDQLAGDDAVKMQKILDALGRSTTCRRSTTTVLPE
jgi:transcriptional/translational regulatory protein YebC/TACO1